MKKIFSSFIMFLIGIIPSFAQDSNEGVRNAVNAYFSVYTAEGYKPSSTMRADSLQVSEERHEITVYANEPFCSQPFTPTVVSRIYADIQRRMPAPYNTYHLSILSPKHQPIEDLVPNMFREGERDESRLWGKTDYDAAPWTLNTSLPYKVTAGLQGRHLFIWPSHGRYFKGATSSWQWQRPYLFCTTEDLLTQSFVYPFLLPMLERAGAIVCSPRERDEQTAEAVVDNDAPSRQGTYSEVQQDGFSWTSSADSTGFAAPRALLTDTVHPFTMGTYRSVTATSRRSQLASASWMPRFPRAGRYAVYVSYASLSNSVPDAHYSIFHRGGRTNVQVNQQMGGGTWVYLGTYDFAEGESTAGRVVLTNQSSHRGVVTADAVRFGGGVGQNERGDAGTSGLPRFLEAARYYAQWAGIPDTLVNTERGANDYNDDLRVRANMLNYLAAGSPYQPEGKGQHVPFELSLALHTDAGIRRDNSIYGSLAICTTVKSDSITNYPSGLSRSASADLANLLLTNATHDLSRTFSCEWTRREMWDRNYAETRMPDVPSALFEMLSHQNFSDMRHAHDPHFKFTMARSIYKTILRYVNYMHGITSYKVQPLPPHAFSATLSADGSSVRLKWKATTDSLEKTAQPTSYIVYTKVGDEAFDNGLNIGNATEFSMSVSEGKIYSFRVAAVNEGGESFPSETLSVFHSKGATKKLLLVNAFTRLSGPAVVETADSLGFDLHRDMGVSYLSTTAFAGRQRNFSREAAGGEGASALGYSGQELMGKRIVGNTFDYPLEHGRSIAACNGAYSFESMSREAFDEGEQKLSQYAAIDYIAGNQADKPYNLVKSKVFTPATRRLLKQYLQKGGALLLSGSYIASDNLASEAERNFTADVLKFKYDGCALNDSTDFANGLNISFNIFRQPNAEHYPTQEPDAIMPACNGAFSVFAYGGQQGAGVAYKGKDYRTVAMAFPFECICQQSIRNAAMKALLKFLTD